MQYCFLPGNTSEVDPVPAAAGTLYPLRAEREAMRHWRMLSPPRYAGPGEVNDTPEVYLDARPVVLLAVTNPGTSTGPAS
jgi:hypothetical protein